MKIFIDTIKWMILKEEKESPFFEGENFASKLRIYVNDNGDSYPTLSLLKANGRKRGPFNYDASGYGTEVVDGIEWNYYDFTLSTINGALDVPGQLLMTCIINTNGSQRAFNFTNNVVKTAIDSDSGIVIYGDDPTDIINDIGKNLDTYQKSVDDHNKAINNITKKIPYGDRTYVKLSHLTANNTIENLYDALGDYNYIVEDNVEYKFYIELGDGTILENIHIKTYSEYYDITSIIRNGIQFKVYIGRIWYSNQTPTITEFIAQHSTIVTYKDIEDFVNFETLGDVIDGVEELIPYGDRTQYFSYNLTAANTVKELITELKSYDKFDENNKGKFYIKLSDGTILENISIEISSSRYYINSIINKRTSIEIFQGQLPTTTTKTIEQLINEHKAITTKDYVDEKVANLINSAPETLDTLGELAAALEDNKEVVEVLNEAIGKKANKEDLPTKLSDLENDDNNYLTRFENNPTTLVGKWVLKENITQPDPTGGSYGYTINYKDSLGNEYKNITFTPNYSSFKITGTNISTSEVVDIYNINFATNTKTGLAFSNDGYYLEFAIEKPAGFGLLNALKLYANKEIIPENIKNYVDEKVANAGVPSDLLNRVETLETNKANKTEIPTKTSQLTNDSAFINQTQLDEALANVGGGGSEKIYHYSSLNINNTIKELCEELKTEGKFYIEFSDGNKLEDIHIRYTLFNTRINDIYINSVIRKDEKILIYVGKSAASYPTIESIISQHSEVVSKKSLDGILSDKGTLFYKGGVGIENEWERPDQETFEMYIDYINDKNLVWDWEQYADMFAPAQIRAILLYMNYGTNNSTTLIRIPSGLGGLHNGTTFIIYTPDIWEFSESLPQGNLEFTVEGVRLSDGDPETNNLVFSIDNMEEIKNDGDIYIKIEITQSGFTRVAVLQEVNI